MSPNALDFYCVSCKTKVVTSDYRIKISDSGRRMAQGMCPQCKKTKVNRILGKDTAYVSPNHPVFYNQNLTTEEAKPNNEDEKPNKPQYRVKLKMDGARHHWWELQQLRPSGEYIRVASGYAFTKRGSKRAVKHAMKRLAFRYKESYVDLNYNPL